MEPTYSSSKTIEYGMRCPVFVSGIHSLLGDIMASIATLDTDACRKLGLYPLSNPTEVVGHDFCYDWNRVRAAARKVNQNLEQFLSLPIGARLAEKGLRTPVTFWFTPLGQLFVVTVCSTRNVDFMTPLHSLSGYVEYGANHLRPTARPFLHYNDLRITRVHMLDAPPDSSFLVADFGNAFGLTVTGTENDQFNEIRQCPSDYFEYSAIPSESEENVSWNGREFVIHHALYVLR